MHRHLAGHCGEPPMTLMTGGAGWKVAPYLDVEYELVDSLIFDGLLTLQSHRLAL
jgi:type III pantothenate kinase